MPLVALRCCTDPWTSSVLEHLDATVARAAELETIDWTVFSYLKDHLHFTPRSQKVFFEVLSRIVCQRIACSPTTASIYVISDSTIAHWSWAPRTLRRLLQKKYPDKKVVVDAVCGSGYVAESDRHLNFGARLRKALKQKTIDGDTLVLVVGGWNDLCASPSLVSDAASRCLADVERAMKIGVRRPTLLV